MSANTRASQVAAFVVGTLLFFGIRTAARAAEPVVQNVVLITLDGLRGEEVFGGADQRLMTAENGVKSPDQLKLQFWRESRIERRELLLPFFWSQCGANAGWIAGDIESGS